MIRRYIKRSVETVLRKGASEFPAVVLTGPRQSGKTTLLTGSQNLLMVEKITESLAGRTAMLRLLPLSRREAEGRPLAFLPWESGDPLGSKGDLAYGKIWNDFLRGGYPELVVDPGRDIGLWHAGYVQTYLERDVRALRQVGDLSSRRRRSISPTSARSAT